MRVGRLVNILKDCKSDSKVVIFVTTENGMYRPFRNIEPMVCNKNSSMEELHLDVSIHREYKSVHFPNNLSKEEVLDLKEKRKMLLEELEDIEKQIGDYLW